MFRPSALAVLRLITAQTSLVVEPADRRGLSTAEDMIVFCFIIRSSPSGEAAASRAQRLGKERASSCLVWLRAADAGKCRCQPGPLSTALTAR